jgi:hypothetical protein
LSTRWPIGARRPAGLTGEGGCEITPESAGGYTGILVHNASNQDLASAGDSGGPWYIGEIALGTTSCASWVEPYGYIDMIYVASNYVEGGLNVTIKTTP